MNNYMKDKLNQTLINRDILEELCKDRLDFGFDSLYFRFATIVDELKIYKEKEYNKDMTGWANNQKQRFYEVLEQLTHAHEENINGINS